MRHPIELIFDEGNEVVPFPVDLDATQLEQGLSALLDPAHASVVEALGDDMLHGTLDDARGNLIVVVAKLAVGHHVLSFRQIADHRSETESVSAFSRTSFLGR